MKKIATIMGLFGLIFVQAQVGINQDAPKATLDIKAQTANTTEDVEGLLVPRVSKNKAFLMAGNTTTPLKESTLVYVDNTADYTTTPVVTSVEDITEKGYYFWNGTKWVKTAGENGAEWVYDPATKQINLKRSGAAPFTNKIIYDEKGLLKNYTQDRYEYWDSSTQTYKMSIAAIDVNSNYLQRNSPSLASITNAYGKYKDLTNNVLVADETTNEGWQMTGGIYRIITKKDNVANYRNLRGFGASATHQANGKVSYLVGGSFSSTLSNQAVSDGYVTGLRSSANLFGNSSAVSMDGLRTYTVDWGSGSTSEFNGTFNIISFEKNASSTIDNASGVTLFPVAHINNSSKITNLRGIHYKPEWRAGNNTTVQHEYGIYLAPIVKGTVSKYAIYTNAGKVRLGDETSVTRNLNSFTAGENIHGYKSELTLTGASAFTEDVNGYWANVKSDGGISTNGVFVHATQTGNNTTVSPAMPLVSGTYGDAKVEKATSAYNAIGAAGMAESTQKGSNTGLNGVARNATKINIGVNAIANATDAEIATEIGAKLASGFTAAVNAFNPSTGVNDFAINAKGKVRVENLPTATATETTNVVVADATGVLKTKSATDLVAKAAEWVYDPVTKQTNLKRSGTAPFGNKVFYDEKGLLKNYTQDRYEYWDSSTQTYKMSIAAIDEISNYLQRNTLSLASNTNAFGKYKDLTNNVLVADETTNEGWQMTGGVYHIITKKDNVANYRNLRGFGASATHQANGKVSYLVGGSFSSTLSNQAVSDGYVTGLRSSANLFGNSSAVSMDGLRTYTVDWGSGSTSEFNGTFNIISFEKNASSSIANASGVTIFPVAHINNSSKITNLRGIHYKPEWKAGNNTTVQHEYGIYLDPIVKGTVSKYAIYTNAGKVRFGDSVGIGIDAPVEKLEVNGNVKISGVTKLDPQSIVANGACDNGSIGYGSDGNFYACKGTQWKQLQLAP